MSDRPYNVLFLCTGNSARSILAEGLLNHLGHGRFQAYSAGSQPSGTVNPFALETLQKLGIDGRFARSKSWDEFTGADAPKMDFIFTVCDDARGETCPVWPGQPVTAHWGVDDPAAVEGSDERKRQAFHQTLAVLRNRLQLFASLPVDKLDRLSLQHKLLDIGQTR